MGNANKCTESEDLILPDYSFNGQNHIPKGVNRSVFLIYSIILLLFSFNCVQAGTIYVPDDYSSIQWGSANCFIQTPDSSDGVLITADHVNLSGFTDSNLDGIGDDVYNLGNEQDEYPLIQPFENYVIIEQFQMPLAPSIPMFIYGMVFDRDLSEKAPENTTVIAITDRGHSVVGKVDENGWYGQPVSDRLVISECDSFNIVIELNGTMLHLGPYLWEEGAIKRIDLNYSTIPPSAITNLTATTGNFWISWTWENPSDSDFGSVIIYLDGIPEASISGSNYNRTFAPHETHTISIRTRDVFGNINTTWVNNTATIPNNPPELSHIEDFVIEKGDTVEIRLSASDIDGDQLVYYCNSTDMFVNFNTTTGEGVISTVNCTPGEYVIEFGVADSYGGFDNTTVNVTVNETLMAVANLTADTYSIKTTAGSTATFILNLNNTGNLEDNFTLIVDIPDGISATLSDTFIRLNESENRTLTLDASSGSEGTYRINITAIPVSFPENSDFVNLTAKFEKQYRAGSGGGGGQYGIGYIPPKNPVAVIDYAPEKPAVNISILFNASGSYAINTSIKAYSWDFGDGSSGEGVTVNYSYVLPGRYRVKLEVVDEEKRLNSTFIEINVSNETVLFFNPPTPGNNSLLNYSSITINVTSNKPITHLSLQLNGEIEEMNGSDFNWWLDKKGLKDGVYAFLVFTDNATSELRNFVIDTESPQIEDLSYRAGSDWIQWTWTNPDDLSQLEVYLNGESQQLTADNQLNATNLIPGTYKLEIKTVDKANNSAYISQTVEISPARKTETPATISKIVETIPVEVIKEEKDVNGPPQTQIVLIVAGVISAVVIFIALRRRS